jgi:hypothetical protein
MAREGRIEGRVSQDGTAYELWQSGTLRQSIPIAQAHADERLKRTIKRNKWTPLP